MRFEAAIFDMDGTILDTLEDLRQAINYAFGQAGLLGERKFTLEEAGDFFGSGITVAVQRAFKCLGLPEDQERMGQVEEIYRPYYSAHCAENTAPYPGIVELLETLRDRGIRCAAVSNKPDQAVRQLCETYFKGLFDYVQGENVAAGIRKKPAPDMTDSALEALGISRERAVYIGDSEVDIQTAANSGMPCISVLWGFRGRAYLVEHGGDTFVENCGELLQLLTAE